MATEAPSFIETAATPNVDPGPGASLTAKAPLAEIKVTTPTGPAPAAPKSGSAKDRLFKSLRAKIGAEDPETTEQSQTPAKPDDSTKTVSATTEPKTTTDPKSGKVNPWKLVDEHKERAKKLESEIVELRKLVPNEQARKEELERLQKAEARAKELDDEIRFVNYERSDEFKQKYLEPYNKAWERAMHELREVTIADETGEQRAVKPTDLVAVFNAPIARAREIANEMFGEFADDVMAFRKEIRGLADAQQQAITEARKSSAERDAQRVAEMTRKKEASQKLVAAAWQKYNEATQKDPKYGQFFTPVEGDEELNTRLDKGYKLVDQALSMNPFDPNLSDDQRDQAVKMHAAVRNRAAAFGRVMFELARIKAEKLELEEKLKQYSGSVPEVGGSKPAPTTGMKASARDEIFGALRKLAH